MEQALPLVILTMTVCQMCFFCGNQVGDRLYFNKGNLKLQDRIYLNDGKGVFTKAKNRLPEIHESS